MGKKLGPVPAVKLTLAPPEKLKSPEQVAADILTDIRQLEPEQQNQVVNIVLLEIGTDRSKTLQQFREGQERAAKNLDVFVTQAVSFEKALCELLDRKAKG